MKLKHRNINVKEGLQMQKREELKHRNINIKKGLQMQKREELKHRNININERLQMQKREEIIYVSEQRERRTGLKIQQISEVFEMLLQEEKGCPRKRREVQFWTC